MEGVEGKEVEEDVFSGECAGWHAGDVVGAGWGVGENEGGLAGAEE